LPDYMVPRRLHVVNRLPRNVNGKFDRSALLAILGEGK
jgi:acyl-coenzyme A synthetase/AMP-(fatty) acid ligase